MPITVLYFAAAREAAGTSSESLDVASVTIAELRRELVARHPELARVLPRCRFAVNQELVADSDPVPPDAEVALIPPVSGGGPAGRVVERPLELGEAIAAVRDPEHGAVVTFQGDVRGVTGGRRVLRLEYEAYTLMAEKTLTRLAEEIGREHGAEVAIVHRVGRLLPGDAAVVIACAAPHRAPAFRACEAAIERLKREAPIWKREVFEDGSEWVGLGP